MICRNAEALLEETEAQLSSERRKRKSAEEKFADVGVARDCRC